VPLVFFRKIFAVLAIIAAMMERARKDDGAKRTSSDPCARTQPQAAIGREFGVVTFAQRWKKN
jgi:hypothetical protein